MGTGGEGLIQYFSPFLWGYFREAAGLAIIHSRSFRGLLPELRRPFSGPVFPPRLPYGLPSLNVLAQASVRNQRDRGPWTHRVHFFKPENGIIQPPLVLSLRFCVMFGSLSMFLGLPLSRNEALYPEVC